MDNECNNSSKHNLKVVALGNSLQESLFNFKGLVSDFEQLYIDSENYKTQLVTQKEKCESKSCSSAEALKKVIASKDHIIQLVASALTKLNETKNFSIIDEAFKILCGETTVMTPPRDSQESKSEKLDKLPNKIEIKKPMLSPKKEFSPLIDVSMKEESISEIDNTPTGRTSPIIQSRKFKSINSPDVRDKKKCPDNWITPEKKMLKLSFPTPSRTKANGKLRQSRLNLVKLKPTSVLDLTSSPEFAGGSRSGRSFSACDVQPLIKKESIENDDTILPSPTSGPVDVPILYKVTSKDSPIKFRRTMLSLKNKHEMNENELQNKQENEENIIIKNVKDEKCEAKYEDSINILRQLPNRIPAVPQYPIIPDAAVDEDITHCDTNSSISLLQHVNMLEKKSPETTAKINQCSPSKRPLAENINVTNVPMDDDKESSMSLLPQSHNVIQNIAATTDTAKKKPEPVEAMYKEPTVRKKAEKRALPGWSCDECVKFFEILHKDDPERAAKEMVERCSKHRGRTNPVRPKTPPGFWYPRWDVPEDTEEFNRRNNAV